MRLRIVAAALAFGCVAALSISARADTFGPWSPKTVPVGEYGKYYMSLGAGAFVQQTPRVNFGTIYNGAVFPAPSVGPIISSDPSIVGGIGGATLGAVFDTRRTPAWLGKKPRVEVSFSYSRGSGGDDQTSTFSHPIVVGTPLVDGTVGGLFGIVTGVVSNASLDLKFEEVAGAIRLKTDIHLARNLYLTPSFGFVGGHSSTDFNFNSSLLDPRGGPATGGFGSIVSFVNESLKTRRLGGEAALDVSWKASSKLTVHGGASASIFRMGTRLNANDCISSGVPVGSPCNGGGGASTVSNFDHQTGYRVGMNGGVTYDGGWFRLTLVGQGLWDSHVPGVRNPTTPFQTSGGASSPAQIVYGSGWRYGGFLAFTIPLQ